MYSPDKDAYPVKKFNPNIYLYTSINEPTEIIQKPWTSQKNTHGMNPLE